MKKPHLKSLMIALMILGVRNIIAQKKTFDVGSFDEVIINTYWLPVLK